ncbi:MAG: hypothetical protein NWR83_07615 [Salibacteraceae bacterium]|nr:hypothetical protein [Salibacteraceae bacterium]
MTLEGQGFVAYIPFGLSYFGKRRCSIGANLGPGTSYFNLEKLFIYGSVNIGLPF